MAVDTGRRPAGPPPPRGPQGPRWLRDPRSVHDRVSFKPIAALLLVPVIIATAVLTAAVLAPPFAAAGFGVNEIRSRLDALGSDFTRIPRFPERSTIYAADGSVLTRVFLDNREIVPLTAISEPAQEAVLAIEDSDFFAHGALDWSSLIRAMIENARAGEIVQGGSTITQQLVGSTLGLKKGFDQSLEGKFQELALAVRVEQRYPKEKIFELYLNQVYLGSFEGTSVYGLGTAAQFYYRKPARDLTLLEGATLAGMIRAPGYYNPLVHRKKSLLRRNDVLNRMEGLGWITEERADRLKAKPLALPDKAGKVLHQHPPFFVRYLTEQIVENESGEFTDALGATESARRQRLYEGGLDIHTTFEPEWQDWAETVANQPLRVPIYPPGRSPPPDVSIVTIENKTGAVKVIVSGRNYRHDELDLATTPHQPGSAFKPFVLAGAFKVGIPPTQTYSSSSPWCSSKWDDEDHCVANAEPGGGGIVDLWRATEDSINVVFAQLIFDVGPSVVAEIAERMIGMDPRTEGLPSVAALATGSVGISPIQMAAGYQTIANDGQHCQPYTVERIEDDGKLLLEHEPECARVMKQGDARLITAMLEAVPKTGTASSAFAYGGWGERPVAGKTGTAQENTNVWFSGYTHQYTTSVWVGSPGNPYPMGHVFGGTVAAPIWVAYMTRIMKGFPMIDFPKPPHARVPDVVGMTRKEAIKALKEEHFAVDVEIADSLAPKGEVFAQSPGPGTVLILGTRVTIQVSTGNPPMATVPRLIGSKSWAAQSLLRSLGLAVSVEEVETSDPKEVGIVLAQDPERGTSLPQGSTVTIVVGVEPKGGGDKGKGKGNGGGGGGGD
jgi:penicillin-binding protein 1A